MARRLPGAVSRSAADRGAAARGERAADPAQASRRVPALRGEVGAESERGRGGRPRSPARPEADPRRTPAGRTPPAGVWGLGSRAEWPTPSVWSPGLRPGGPPGCGDVGHRKGGCVGGRPAPWRPGETTPPSLALGLAAPCAVSERRRERPFLKGLVYFCQRTKKTFPSGLSAGSEGVDSGALGAETWVMCTHAAHGNEGPARSPARGLGCGFASQPACRAPVPEAASAQLSPRNVHGSAGMSACVPRLPARGGRRDAPPPPVSRASRGGGC